MNSEKATVAFVTDPDMDSGLITMEQGKLRTPQFFHALAIAALPLVSAGIAILVGLRFGVSMLDIVLLAGMFVLTILGITAGYHRLFSHRSFEAATPIRVLLGILGSMAAQGSISYWVSN